VCAVCSTHLIVSILPQRLIFCRVSDAPDCVCIWVRLLGENRGGGGDVELRKPWPFKTNYIAHLTWVLSIRLYHFVYSFPLLHLAVQSEKRWEGWCLRTKWTHEWKGGVQKLVTSLMSCLFVCVSSPYNSSLSTLVAFQFAEFIDHKLFTPQSSPENIWYAIFPFSLLPSTLPETL
jgi:hypothetical protein